MKLGWKRLLKLADILDVADAQHKAKGEPKYKQTRVAHHCNSPACAIGHYAASSPSKHALVVWNGEYSYYDNSKTPAEFDISYHEDGELFGAFGCGKAKTAKAAAKYIRAFVKRKEREAHS